MCLFVELAPGTSPRPIAARCALLHVVLPTTVRMVRFIYLPLRFVRILADDLTRSPSYFFDDFF